MTDHQGQHVHKHHHNHDGGNHGQEHHDIHRHKHTGDNIDGNVHEHDDPGAFYSQAWVQEQLVMIDKCLRKDAEWLGISRSRPQRILDYACGNGTVTKAFLEINPGTTFHGIDSSAAQVRRYNDEASKRGIPTERMHAVTGDLSSPEGRQALDSSGSEREWTDFDLAVTSMALHHFDDPVGMLRQLAGRVKRAGEAKGVVAVVDFCPSELIDRGISRESGGAGEGKETAALDVRDRVQVHNGQSVWIGFTPGKLAALMEEAGCGQGLETRVYDEKFRVPRLRPESGDSSDRGGRDDEGADWVQMKLVVARGSVA